MHFVLPLLAIIKDFLKKKSLKILPMTPPKDSTGVLQDWQMDEDCKIYKAFCQIKEGRTVLDSVLLYSFCIKEPPFKTRAILQSGFQIYMFPYLHVYSGLI